MASFRLIRELTLEEGSTKPDLDKELKAAEAMIKEIEKRSEEIRSKIKSRSAKKAVFSKKRTPAKKRRT